MMIPLHKSLRGLAAALAAVLVFWAALPAYAASSSEIQEEIDDLNSQKSEIQDRMDDIQAEIDSLDYEKSNTLEKKLILDRKNELAEQELGVIEEQIAIVDGLIANMQQDLNDARAEEEYQRQRWQTRVRAMEESSDIDYLQVLFEATSFSDLLTRLDLVNEVMAYDEALEAQYIAARQNVEALEAEAEQLFAENTVRRQELETKQAQLTTDIEAATNLIASMETNQEEYEAILEQEAATKALIEQEIAEKREEYQAALAAEQAAMAAAGNGTIGAGFMWPSYTRWLTSKYGPRLISLYGYWRNHDGVDIGAVYGSSVWAAAGGVVITAGWYGGYGKCVMVMHPNGYTTLYGHMSSIAVYSGQTVAQGQVLGYVGSTGNSEGPHLHFEIRLTANPSQTFNPESFAYY